MTPIRILSRRRLLGLAGCAVGASLPLAGCGGVEPRYYTLASSPGSPAPGGPATVEVRTPSIAPYLDRDSIVRRDTGNELTLAYGSHWAGALAGMIGRTLAVNLAQRLPGSTVFAESAAISTAARALVELDVSRFLEDGKGNAELQATLSVSRPDSPPAGTRLLHLTRAPANASLDALVAALSALLGDLADIAAAELRALPAA